MTVASHMPIPEDCAFLSFENIIVDKRFRDESSASNKISWSLLRHSQSSGTPSVVTVPIMHQMTMLCCTNFFSHRLFCSANRVVLPFDAVYGIGVTIQR
jgi:hypothetical protein